MIAGSAAVLALSASTILRMEALRHPRPVKVVAGVAASQAEMAAARPRLPGDWPDEPLMPRLVQLPRRTSDDFAANLPADGYSPGVLWPNNPLPPVGPPLLVQGPGQLARPDQSQPTGAQPQPTGVQARPPARPIPIASPVVPPPPAKSAETTPERPLVIALHLPDEGLGTLTPGQIVQVKLGANVPCYVLLLRVDASGHASVAYPPRIGILVQPGQAYDQVFKAAAIAGTEYLVAVAALYPLSAADALAALKTAGTPPELHDREHGGPGAAAVWETLQNFLSAAARDTQPELPNWGRHEWFVTAAALPVRPMEMTPASDRAAPTEKVAASQEQASPVK
ncbi:MAG: hypothetical protein HY320_03155 [Armatimonadetes bacterium]|nr:hypothetical protein [Armatimonadota bacterium]